MNWYKIAKVIDYSDNPLISNPLLCPTCKRWGTSDDNNKIIWKHYYQMPPEEQKEVDNIKKLHDRGATKLELHLCEDCDK